MCWKQNEDHVELVVPCDPVPSRLMPRAVRMLDSGTTLSISIPRNRQYIIESLEVYTPFNKETRVALFKAAELMTYHVHEHNGMYSIVMVLDKVATGRGDTLGTRPSAARLL